MSLIRCRPPLTNWDLTFFLNIFFFLHFFFPKVTLTLPGKSLVAQTVKRLPIMRETRVRSLGRKDSLEKEMAIHSSTLAWKIPWTEEPGRLPFMGSQRSGHDLSPSFLSNNEIKASLFAK